MGINNMGTWGHGGINSMGTWGHGGINNMTRQILSAMSSAIIQSQVCRCGVRTRTHIEHLLRNTYTAADF